MAAAEGAKSPPVDDSPNMSANGVCDNVFDDADSGGCKTLVRALIGAAIDEALLGTDEDVDELVVSADGICTVSDGRSLDSLAAPLWPLALLTLLPLLALELAAAVCVPPPGSK